MFNDETSSLLSKKQHHQRDDLESNTFVAPSPDDDELFQNGSILNKTKTKTHHATTTKKFVVAIGALCVGGSALAVSTSSSSSSSSLRMFNTSRLGGGEEEFETAGGTRNFSENGVDESELLIDAKGTQYRGKQTKSVTGKDCKNWVQTTMHPDDHPNDGLYENYCRNPQGQQETIFCFVGGGETEKCEPLGFKNVLLTQDEEEVERLERELAQAEEEAKLPRADGDESSNPQEPQVGEIIITEEVPGTRWTIRSGRESRCSSKVKLAEITTIRTDLLPMMDKWFNRNRRTTNASSETVKRTEGNKQSRNLASSVRSGCKPPPLRTITRPKV
jgi:hypothetical protein